MPLSFPTTNEIISRLRADVAASLPGSDPTLENSILDAVLSALGSRLGDFYIDINRLLNELFPQTASGEFLDFFGEVFGVTRLQASVSTGSAVFNGTLTTLVPSGTEFTSGDGNLFTSTAAVNVSSVVQNISTLARSGTTVTATFTADHGLSTNTETVISGATEPDYNGVFTISVTSATEFQYTIVGAPSTPATGTPISTSAIAIVPVESNEVGADNNLNSGAALTVTSTIVGLNSKGYVNFNGMTGGADIEDDDNYRDRIILERSSLEALFNAAQIEQQARTVSGVTRVLVKEITPVVGAVTILFVRDDDTDSIIPSPAEVTEVFNALVEIKPAHIDDGGSAGAGDLIVKAPTPVLATFDFTALSPDSPELREAITSNLTAFFREEVTFEETIEQGEYESVIFTTVDPQTGTKVESFTLSSPAGDITVTTDEIAVLNSVSYSI